MLEMAASKYTTLPGFTAERSFSQMSEQYILQKYDYLSEGDKIVPQGCGFWKWLKCAAVVTGCTVVCAYTTPSSWYQCMVTCVVSTGAGGCVSCIT
jgi:hypothetical protein